MRPILFQGTEGWTSKALQASDVIATRHDGCVTQTEGASINLRVSGDGNSDP